MNGRHDELVLINEHGGRHEYGLSVDYLNKSASVVTVKDMISFCYVDGQMIARNEGKLKIAVKEEKVEEEEEERSSVLVGMALMQLVIL